MTDPVVWSLVFVVALVGRAIASRPRSSVISARTEPDAPSTTCSIAR